MGIKIADLFYAIGADLSGLTKGMTKAGGMLSNLNKKIEAQSAQFRAVGLAATAMGTALVGGLGLGVKAAAEFQIGITNTLNLLGEDGKEWEETFSSGIKNVSARFGLGKESIQKALFDITSAMIPPSEAMEFLGASAELAVAGVAGVDATTKAIITTLESFEGNITSAADASDFLFSVQKGGITTISELSESFGKVAPLASLAGVSAETLGAALATVTGAGISTKETVTALQQLINKFITPTDAATEAAKQLGFELNSGSLQGNAFEFTMKKLQKATIEQQVAIAGSVEAFKALGPIVKNVTGFHERYEIIVNRQGLASAAAAEISKTFSNQLDRLKESASNIAITIGTALLPMLSDIALKVEPILKGLGAWIEAHPKLTTALTLTAAAVGVLLLAIGPILIVLPSLAAGVTAVVTVLGTLSGIIPALLGIMAVLGVAVVVLKSQWENLVSVWEIVVESIDGLVTGLVTRITEKLESFGVTLNEIWLAIQGAFNIFAGGITDILNGLAVPFKFIDKIVRETFGSWGELFEVVGATIIDSISTIASGFVTGLNGILDFLGSFIIQIGKFLDGWIDKINTVAAFFGKEALPKFGEAFTKFGESVKGALGSAAKFAGEAFDTLVFAGREAAIASKETLNDLLQNQKDFNAKYGATLKEMTDQVVIASENMEESWEDIVKTIKKQIQRIKGNLEEFTKSEKKEFDEAARLAKFFVSLSEEEFGKLDVNSKRQFDSVIATLERFNKSLASRLREAGTAAEEGTKKITNAFKKMDDDIKESVGGVVDRLRTFNKQVTITTSAFNPFADRSEELQNRLNASFTGMKDDLDNAGIGFRDFKQRLFDLVRADAWDQFAIQAGKAKNAIDILEAQADRNPILRMNDQFADQLKRWKKILAEFNRGGQGSQEFFQQILENIAAMFLDSDANLEAFLDSVKEAMAEMEEVMDDAVGKSWFTDATENIVAGFEKITNAAKNFAKDATKPVKDGFNSIKKNMASIFVDQVASFSTQKNNRSGGNNTGLSDKDKKRVEEERKATLEQVAFIQLIEDRIRKTLFRIEKTGDVDKGELLTIVNLLKESGLENLFEGFKSSAIEFFESGNVEGITESLTGVGRSLKIIEQDLFEALDRFIANIINQQDRIKEPVKENVEAFNILNQIIDVLSGGFDRLGSTTELLTSRFFELSNIIQGVNGLLSNSLQAGIIPSRPQNNTTGGQESATDAQLGSAFGERGRRSFVSIDQLNVRTDSDIEAIASSLAFKIGAGA